MNPHCVNLVFAISISYISLLRSRFLTQSVLFALFEYAIIKGCQSSLECRIFFPIFFCKVQIRSPQLWPPRNAPNLKTASLLKEIWRLSEKSYSLLPFDEEDSFEDEIDDLIAEKMEIFKSSLIFNHLTYFILLAAELALLWCLEKRFPQNNGPSHSSSPNVVINFLQQLGWIKFLYSGTYTSF